MTVVPQQLIGTSNSPHERSDRPHAGEPDNALWSALLGAGRHRRLVRKPGKGFATISITTSRPRRSGSIELCRAPFHRLDQISATLNLLTWLAKRRPRCGSAPR